MKITYTKNVPVVTFKDIAVGGCFIDPEGCICMRISQDIHSQINTLCFSDNKTYEFNNSYPVRPIEVELIVHKEAE
jgi:hypothetical protein